MDDPKLTTRRTLLRIGSLLVPSLVLPAGIAAALKPSPIDGRAVLDDYIAWLAHEHRAALVELYDSYKMPSSERDEFGAFKNTPASLAELRRRVPLAWVPDHRAQAIVEAAPPSSRAVAVLGAIGLLQP